MGLTRRRPSLAPVLTILRVGVGHLYCGRLRRGLVFLAAAHVGVPAIVASTPLPPGDVVEGRDGTALVDQEPLPLEPVDASRGIQRERIGGRTHLVRPGGDLRETTVPEGAYALLGDNRLASRDSRRVGPIAAADIGGCVEYVRFVQRDWKRIGAFDR